jgi:hypothetical protein
MDMSRERHVTQITSQSPTDVFNNFQKDQTMLDKDLNAANPLSSNAAGARQLARLARLAVTSVATVGLFLGAGVAFGAEHEYGCEPNDHASPKASYRCASAGDLIEVTLGDLHPTQAVLGFYEVYYKLGRYQAGKDTINKRFDDWCEANGQLRAAWADANSRLDNPSSFGCVVAIGAETPETIDPMKTAVIGDDGKLFLVDGHHTFTSFIESPDGGPDTRVRVRVLGNLSELESKSFWRAMEDSGWVWLRDENNAPITARQLPKRLGLANFHNDNYRGLVYFTRDIAYSQNSTNANYQEFYWGSWLRTNPSFNLSTYNLEDFTSYLAGVTDAATLMASLNDGDLVASGFTAADLGRINFNANESTKAKKDYCNSKPGKVAYALYYYHNILGVPPALTCP